MIDLDFEEYLTLEITKILLEAGISDASPCSMGGFKTCPQWFIMRCNPSDLAKDIIKGGNVMTGYPKESIQTDQTS